MSGTDLHPEWLRLRDEVEASWKRHNATNPPNDDGWDEHERQYQALNAKIYATPANSLPGFLAQVTVAVRIAEEHYDAPELFENLRAFIASNGGPKS